MSIRKEHKRHSRKVTSTKRWKVLRAEILEHDRYRCQSCGCGGRLEVDHIKPVRTHPQLSYDPRNLQALCPGWPVTTSAVTAGWADGETANVAGPTNYATTDRAMSPDHNLGIQMRITRKTLKQSGAALEQAVRRDMSGAMGAAMDQAAFLGTGANGQPLGVITGAATYGITSTAVDALASWGAFRSAVTRFMTANAAGSPDAVRALIRPELWDYLDSALISGTAVSEWDRLVKNLPSANIAMTNNALAAPSGTPSATSALLTTAAGGVAAAATFAYSAVNPDTRLPGLPLHPDDGDTIVALAGETSVSSHMPASRAEWADFKGELANGGNDFGLEGAAIVFVNAVFRNVCIRLGFDPIETLDELYQRGPFAKRIPKGER